MDAARRRCWIAGAAIALAVTAAYGNSLRGEFVLDDRYSVLENPDVVRFLPLAETLLDFGFDDAPSAGRPLVGLSLVLNYKLGGFEPWGYHLFNLIVHALGGLALFGLVRRTLERVAAVRGVSLPLAGAVALVWAVHPLHSGAVTYISQRAEALMGLFFLLTFYCVVRGSASERPWRSWYPAALLACLLSVSSKEVGAAIPVLMVLYDRIYLAESWRGVWRKRGLLHAGLAASWLVTLGLLLTDPRPRSVALFGGLGITNWNYAATQCNAIAMYLGKLFWPHPLLVDYGWPMALEFRDFAASAALVLALGLAALWALIARPQLGFLGAWFFATLAPSSSVLPILTEIMAEHRMYLPSAAAIAAAVLGVWWLGQRAARVGWLRPIVARRLAVALLTVAVLAFLIRTHAQNALYYSEEGFWRHHVRWTPGNPRAFVSLGDAVLAADRPESLAEAIGHYRRALELASAIEVPRQPQLGIAAEKLASAHYTRRDYARAARYFRMALARSPERADLLASLGAALHSAGNPQAARRVLERSLERAPEGLTCPTQACRDGARLIRARSRAGEEADS